MVSPLAASGAAQPLRRDPEWCAGNYFYPECRVL